MKKKMNRHLLVLNKLLEGVWDCLLKPLIMAVSWISVTLCHTYVGGLFITNYIFISKAVFS